MGSSRPHSRRSVVVLPGAVRTDQAEDLAARDFEIEMIDGRQLAEAARQIDGANDARSSRLN